MDGDTGIRDAGLVALVGGIEGLVRECLRTRGARQLPALGVAATGPALRLLDGGVRDR